MLSRHPSLSRPIRICHGRPKPKTIAVPDAVPVRRALLSVSDKTGLVDFARRSAGRGVELVSTGGTRAALAAAGIAVIDVADVTGFPGR